MPQHTRYQLMPVALQNPGVDFITKSPNGPMIDTGKVVTFEEGRWGHHIYLSVDTIREMAEIAGLFEGLSPTEEVDEETPEYKAGYADALKENLHGQLADIADRLGFVADRLGAFDTADLVDAPIEPIAVGAEPTGSFDNEPSRDTASGVVTTITRPIVRQSARADLDKRSNSLPGNTGDDSAFRI